MVEYMLLIILKAISLGEMKLELFSRYFPRNGKVLKFFFLKALLLISFEKNVGLFRPTPIKIRIKMQYLMV
jgi:hypothetical protein